MVIAPPKDRPTPDHDTQLITSTRAVIDELHALHNENIAQFNKDFGTDHNLTPASNPGTPHSATAEWLLRYPFPHWSWVGTIYGKYEPPHGEQRISHLAIIREKQEDFLRKTTPVDKRHRKQLAWQNQKLVCLKTIALHRIEYAIITSMKARCGYKSPKEHTARTEILQRYASTKSALKQNSDYTKENAYYLRRITDWEMSHHRKRTRTDSLIKAIEYCAPVLGLACAIAAVVLLMAFSHISGLAITVLGYAAYMGYLPSLIALGRIINNLCHGLRPSIEDLVDLVICLVSVTIGQIPGILALYSGTTYINMKIYSTMLEGGRQIGAIIFDMVASVVLTYKSLFYRRFLRGQAFYSAPVFTKYAGYLSYLKPSTILHYHKKLEATANKRTLETYIPLLQAYRQNNLIHPNRHHRKEVTKLIGYIQQHGTNNHNNGLAEKVYGILTNPDLSAAQKIEAFTQQFKEGVPQPYSSKKYNSQGSLARRLYFIAASQEIASKETEAVRTRAATQHTPQAALTKAKPTAPQGISKRTKQTFNEYQPSSGQFGFKITIKPTVAKTQKHTQRVKTLSTTAVVQMYRTPAPQHLSIASSALLVSIVLLSGPTVTVKATDSPLDRNFLTQIHAATTSQQATKDALAKVTDKTILQVVASLCDFITRTSQQASSSHIIFHGLFHPHNQAQHAKIMEVPSTTQSGSAMGTPTVGP